MIYSSTHRLSPFESLLNLAGPIATTLATLWAVFETTLIPSGTNILDLTVWVVLSLVFSIAVHESGHLVAGLLVHRPVRKILIGSGRTLFTARPGDIRIQVCVNLLGGGAVYFSANDDTSAGERVAVTAAGPAVNIVFGLIALAALPLGWPWMGTFALASLMLGAANLIPSRFNSGGRQRVSDGMQIVQLLAGHPMTSTFFEGEELAPDGQRITIGSIEEARDWGSEQLTQLHLLASLDHDREIHQVLAPAAIGDLLRSPGPASSLDVRPMRTPVVDQIYKVTFRIGRDLGIARPNAPCLCLGLMAVPSDVATRLRQGGVSETALRELAIRRVDPVHDARPGGELLPDLPLERWGSAAERVLALALRIAAVDRAADTGTQHILAAIVAERGSRAAQALSRMGFVLHRHDRAMTPGDPLPAPPPLTSEAQSAIAGALLRTGPTFPCGTGELSLGLADQARSMAALLFLTAEVRPPSLQAALVALPGEQSDPTGYTPSMRRMWELRASARLGAGRYADSRSDFLVLEQTAPTDAVRAVNHNNVAWVSLMSGDPALRPEALEKSRAALAIDPQQRSFQGTHAFALLETGDPAAAADVLEKVVVDHPRPRDRALTLCLLAICRARLQDPGGARRRLNEAEEADPKCALLGRARAEIAQPAAPAAPA